MTFSIVGQVGDAYGVAVASRFIAVGAVVPAAGIGVGACATQALARVSYKQDSLDELAAGHTADAAVRRVTAADADAAHRQLGVVGAQTQASYTGTECLPWAGGVSGRDESGGYAIQGNILTGPEVVERMQEAWPFENLRVQVRSAELGVEERWLDPSPPWRRAQKFRDS